jgi:alkanesulfonate monooxygenase SsuD/methylene tetrahydromethanopterin reductase-like flavin-dependent oxidoreductase (luciferase family)
VDQDDPQFQGQYVQFSDIVFLPKPVQQPHPPLWIGGESPAALRRAVALGDAWYPIGSNPQFPLDTAERYTNAIAALHDEAGARAAIRRASSSVTGPPGTRKDAATRPTTASGSSSPAATPKWRAISLPSARSACAICCSTSRATHWTSLGGDRALRH